MVTMAILVYNVIRVLIIERAPMLKKSRFKYSQDMNSGQLNTGNI